MGKNVMLSEHSSILGEGGNQNDHFLTAFVHDYRGDGQKITRSGDQGWRERGEGERGV